MPKDRRYVIDATEMVAGMSFAGMEIARTDIVGDGSVMQVWWSRPKTHRSPICHFRGSVEICIPGPSPREIFPDDADRLRVWPAPLHGEPWQWDDGDSSVDLGPCWWTEEGYCVTPDSLCDRAVDADEHACFYFTAEKQA